MGTNLDDIRSSSQALYKAKKAVFKAQADIQRSARTADGKGEKQVSEVVPRTSVKGRIIKPSARLQN